MLGIFYKATAIWFLLVILAIINAGLREKVLGPVFGSGFALPVSGLLLSIVIFIVSFVCAPVFRPSESKTYILVGAVWCLLTLSFEFLFGHFVAGRHWQEIVQVFNVGKGDLFLLVLLATLVSPWLSAKLRNLI